MSPWPQSHIPICYSLLSIEGPVTHVPIYYSLLSIEGPQSHTYPYTILHCRSRDLSQTCTHMLFFIAGVGTSSHTRTHILFFIVGGGTSVIEHTHILFFIVDGGASVTPHTHILLVFFLVDGGSDEASLWNTFVICSGITGPHMYPIIYMSPMNILSDLDLIYTFS